MRSYHILGIAASVCLASTSTAKAADYVVWWTVVEHDVTPVLQAASQGYVARFSYDGFRFVTDEGGQIGKAVVGQPASFVTKLGTQHTIVYKLHGRSIIRTDTFPGFAMTMRIEPEGGGKCHAGIRYHRSPGAGVFESKRNDGSGPSTATRVEAANARCSMVVPQS